MIPDDSEAGNLRVRPVEGRDSSRELAEQIVTTLREVYLLLESYAPTWYTEELHDKTVAALRATENVNHQSSSSPSGERTCRDSGRILSKPGVGLA
jgi:hypothetical protein